MTGSHFFRSKQLSYLIAVGTVLWNCVALFVLYQMFNPPPEFQEKGHYVMDINEWPRNHTHPPPVFGSYIVSLSYEYAN